MRSYAMEPETSTQDISRFYTIFMSLVGLGNPSVFQRLRLPSTTGTSPRPPSPKPLGFPNLPSRGLVMNSCSPTYPCAREIPVISKCVDETAELPEIYECDMSCISLVIISSVSSSFCSNCSKNSASSSVSFLLTRLSRAT